jgi:hypothetical protein
LKKNVYFFREKIIFFRARARAINLLNRRRRRGGGRGKPRRTVGRWRRSVFGFVFVSRRRKFFVLKKNSVKNLGTNEFGITQPRRKAKSKLLA